MLFGLVDTDLCFAFSETVDLCLWASVPWFAPEGISLLTSQAVSFFLALPLLLTSHFHVLWWRVMTRMG